MFAEPDTILVFTIYYKLFGRKNPPCNAEDNMRAGLVVIDGAVGLPIPVLMRIP